MPVGVDINGVDKSLSAAAAAISRSTSGIRDEDGQRATRFDLKYGMGGLSHEALMTNIELYGTQVVPRVRELLVEA